ncbi:hypothetical protein M413DRAFT_444923 [Hebeloma cylindrosporum]|uniref:Uncharacterized protein n=1 Tax=Hebeloma cylindrosporum TaxID=76867 RepID=A0A0C3BYL8_HEBCY|nr:hypothetical protein M413DRAFT_444923 [Hebeloma cylindrosporum h7]
MSDPNRSSTSDNGRGKEKEDDMHVDPPSATPGGPMDIDRTVSLIDVSDDDSFGSEHDMAAEPEVNLIQLDNDGPANTTGANIPNFPSVPTTAPVVPQAAPPSPTTTLPPTYTPGFPGSGARGSPHSGPNPLIPPSSTITIPPAQTRSTNGSDLPHPLAPANVFPVPSPQIRSSTGTDISRPFAPPSFATVAALSQTRGSAPSSPQATRGSPWQLSLLSSEPPGPPPVYTPRAQSLCVICNEKPAYNDGRRAFPTCGNTCARALEAAKLDAKKATPSGRSNNHPHSSSSSSGYRPSTTSPYQTRQTVIRMCEVCRVRPKYQKNGKIFPTCGLTCAAKLQPPGSVEMCDYCGERPKVVLNGHKFPHCGTTCRDKAKISDVASANAATCKTCLICWQAESRGQSDYCSDECGDVSGTKAPFLLEVPRGHVSFKKVSDCYTSDWKNTRTPCPRIKKVYMVVLKPDFGPRYDEYKTKVSRPTFRRPGNEKRVWIALRRDCGFGDSGNMEPCSSKKCLLCSLVRSSVSKELAQQGIMTTPSLARAIEMSLQNRRPTSKVVLLANVSFGRTVEMTKSELEFDVPPPGFDSVHLVRFGFLGGKTDSEELLVFNGDAVKPLYLITHE